MALSVEQSAHRDPDHPGYWKWSVWIEGQGEELDDIDEVVYRLHPTFRNRIRHIRSRSSKFRLNSAGWGEFKVRAELHKTDGEKTVLEHWLRLEEDADLNAGQADRPAAVAQRQIFMSFAASDSRVADLIASLLERKGINVLSASTVPPEESLVLSVEDGIAESDCAVVIVSVGVSLWMENEIEIARKKGVPLLPVLVAWRLPEFPPEWADQDPLVIKDISESEYLAESIAHRVEERLLRDAQPV